MRYAIVYRDEDHHWIAEVPSLPGCISQGASREEATASIKDAIALYLNDLDDDERQLYQEYIEPELVAIAMVAE